MISFHFHDQDFAPAQKGAAIIPAGIKTKADLFHILKNAIPLPDYFGNNWDALEECLNDLGWLPGHKLILVHEDVPMIESPLDQKIYLKILAGAARTTSRFEIIFPERDRVLVEHLFSDGPRPE
jgi:RNAse (barnase) inhibitor barstar